MKSAFILISILGAAIAAPAPALVARQDMSTDSVLHDEVLNTRQDMSTDGRWDQN